MGYRWDKLMSEVGPIIVGVSLLALWILWVLSRRSARYTHEVSPKDELEQARETLRAEGVSKVRARLVSAGLAVLDHPTLVDKSKTPPQALNMDFMTVFGEGLWLIRVCAALGRVRGELADEHWVDERSHDTESSSQHVIQNPVKDDQRYAKIVKRIAQSKKLSGLTIKYGVIFVGGDFKVSADGSVKLMSLHQFNKLLRSATKTSTTGEAGKLDEARQLWRYINQLNHARSGGEEMGADEGSEA